MEIKHSFTTNHPIPTMLNKVATLLPLLALVIATPSWAIGNQPSHNHSHKQIAREMGKHQDNLNLTRTQQQQSRARQERRQAMRNNRRSMNLTADQKAKIKAIRESSEQQLNAILTPEQQTKRKSHRHGNGISRANFDGFN